MGMSRTGAFYFVCALFASVLAAPPGHCADSPTDPILSLQADPCFVGRPFGDVTPIRVTITNRGPATTAQIDVHNRNAYRATTQYHSRMDLPGGGAKSSIVVYPVGRDNERWYDQPGYIVDVETPSRSVSTQVILPNSGQQTQQMALVGDNLGAISTVGHPVDTNQWINACYVKPENAPTRSVAYVGLSSLVLGDGVERLNAAQWGAIREWVVSGGSLILLAKDYLQLPQVDLLSPVTAHAPKSADVSVPRFSDSYLISQMPVVPKKFVLGDLRPGAERMELAAVAPGSPTFIARRQLGVGTVLFFGLDPTAQEFRTWVQLPYLWQTLVFQSAPIMANTQLTRNAITSAPWMDRDGNVRDRGDEAVAANDPFMIKLPPLPSVVYVFVGYFILAVPVSFVVLKRTRRMNLAWATGPLLAIGFGGTLYLFTARLNTASLSRRTVGVVTAAAGDKAAHFSGDTEIFFPKSGAYDISIPGADSMEYYFVGSDDYATVGNVNRDLESADDGVTVRIPELNVANLSFRRLYHTQSIDFRGGIDADLRRISPLDDPFRLAGTIVNSTGRTLHNAYIAIPKRATGSYDDPILLKLPDVVPGINNIKGRCKVEYGMDGGGPVGWSHVSAPTLYGTTSAADFGPALGKYVGGDDTAQVIISLPGLKLGGSR